MPTDTTSKTFAGAVPPPPHQTASPTSLVYQGSRAVTTPLAETDEDDLASVHDLDLALALAFVHHEPLADDLEGQNLAEGQGFVHPKVGAPFHVLRLTRGLEDREDLDHGDEEAPDARPSVFKLVPHRCKDVFCGNEACSYMARRNQMAKWMPTLKTFHGISMLTLTIPEGLFANGPEALDHLQSSRVRALAATMQGLKRAASKPGPRGITMFSPRWCATLHFQENGQPHYHVSLDAEEIDQGVLTALWQQAVTATLSAPTTPFTEQAVSERHRGQSVEEAAAFIAGYMVDGVVRHAPQWYTDRAASPFTTSRPFRPTGVDARPRPPRKSDGPARPPRRRRTHAERQATCKNATKIIRQDVDLETGELGRPYFETEIAIPFDIACAAAGRVADTDLNELLTDVLAA